MRPARSGSPGEPRQPFLLGAELPGLTFGHAEEHGIEVRRVLRAHTFVQVRLAGCREKPVMSESDAG